MTVFDAGQLTLLIEAGVTAPEIGNLMGTSGEAVWHAWAKITDRSVWSLRQVAMIFTLPSGALPTLAQVRSTDFRIVTPKVEGP